MLEEKIVVGNGSEFPLNGMLTIPGVGNAPFPAVVFVHGSGSSDMDSKAYAVRPFKDFAEGLAKHGIASIRHDKRSFVHARKMMKQKIMITVKEEAIEDALLAADILRNDSRIDSNRIFIAGISMGGLLVPRIDEEGDNFAGLILLAAPARRLEVLMKEQMENPDLKKPGGLLGWIMKKQTNKLFAKLDNLYEISDEEAKIITFMGGTTAFYFKDMGRKQARNYLEGKTKPILIMHGDGDFQVSTERDFNEYKRILKGHPDATFKLYPGLNHLFMPVVCKGIKSPKEEYSKPQHVANYVIDDMASWIKK
ncbi:MAG: lysophospholipase [Lachnospiraceae bacterium]|nr:lysophospholipase [Lachnospiraceae bacterium]